MAVLIDGDGREWVSADAMDRVVAERDALRKGLQGEVEHWRKCEKQLSDPDVVDLAKVTADRLSALLDSGGEKP